jgi:hypothetical protein
LDNEIIPLCDALNEAGFVTTQSCCGHGVDWPRVWFEHSEDDRIERMARFVMGFENGDFRPFFTLFQKEILPAGYLWLLEIHLNDVFRNTPPREFLAKSIIGINQVSEKISIWRRNELKIKKNET